MSQHLHPAGGSGPSHRAVEIALAATTAVFGAIVIYGSWRVGIGWAFDGPRAGFFPFYIGLLILLGSVFNLAQAAMATSTGLFADWAQLRRVASVLVPAVIYVVLIPRLGIYVSSAALIAVFMSWLGRYRWSLTLAVALGLPLFLFLVFERWFLIPLPKGPIEDLLGF
jgi:putative tricarboxylic transport membrane protein